MSDWRPRPRGPPLPQLLSREVPAVAAATLSEATPHSRGRKARLASPGGVADWLAAVRMRPAGSAHTATDRETSDPALAEAVS